MNFCEFDKYATSSYCAIHNEDGSKNLGDITKVDETKLEPFNMICGGSPCQDFSVAGKQKGSVWTCKDCGHEYNPLTVHWSERDKCPCCGSNNIEKTRSSLLVEYLRVIRANKPNFGMYENVKNIVGKQFKDTFKMFTDELDEYGYNVYWKVLNAKDYGIPQNRERVYLIFIKKELDNGKFTYPEPFDNGILNCYVNCGNTKFLADNISLLSQKFFDIRYDIESQGIVIPIRNQFGQLMGVKERFNYDVADGEMKYFYAVPCSMSQTLFGYSQNYEFLVDNTIYIFEAEKSCMQCFSYGIRNCVSLGSGSISIQQVKMLLELNPKKIIFLHDVGYGLENIMRNIDMVKNYSRFTEIELGYWSYFGRGYKDKVSPSDLGKECLENILQNEITMIGDEDDEDEL